MFVPVSSFSFLPLWLVEMANICFSLLNIAISFFFILFHYLAFHLCLPFDFILVPFSFFSTRSSLLFYPIIFYLRLLHFLFILFLLLFHSYSRARKQQSQATFTIASISFLFLLPLLLFFIQGMEWTRD